MSIELKAPTEVHNQLPLLIADVYEAAGALRRRGDHLAALAGQTQTRWQLLSVLSDGQWTVPRAARRLGITRQAVQQIANSLQAVGLLIARPNPDHQRSPLLLLTDRGYNALATITKQADEWHAQVAPALTPQQLATTRATLRALITAAENGAR